MTRLLTVKRKRQYSVCRTFSVYVDHQLVCVNMGDRRPLCVEISDGPHTVTYEEVIKKRSPEPTLIPPGTENVTVILEVQGQKLFTPGTWATTVITGE